MSAVATAGQTYEDVIEEKLYCEAAWVRQARNRLVAENHPLSRRDLVADYEYCQHRYQALAELARECGIID